DLLRRTVVLIAQPDVQRQLAGYLPVIIEKESPFEPAQTHVVRRRIAGPGIHFANHLQGFVVGEIEDAGKCVGWNEVARVLGIRPHPAELAAHFESMASMDPAIDILVAKAALAVSGRIAVGGETSDG